MMKNSFSKAILLFFIFLSLLSFRGYAIEYTTSSTSPLSNSFYNTNAVYYFNITWTNTSIDEPLTEVNFTLVLPNSSTLIYTLTTSPINISNNSSTFPVKTWISFTQDELGPAGPYYYSWSAYNSTNWNTTFPSTTYFIQKASTLTKLFLDGTEGNVTSNYNIYNIANFTAFLNLSNQTVYLYSDYPSWILQNNLSSVIFNFTNLSISGGLYNLTAYWNGSENYSSSYETWFFGVKPYCINNIELPSSSSIYSSGKKYNFSTECIGNINNVIFNWNNNNYTANSTSSIFYYNLTDLAAGTYNYRWYANDTSNHIFDSGQNTYTVNPIPVTLTLSCTDSDWSITSGSSVTVSCVSNVSTNLRITVDSGVANESLSPTYALLTNRLDNDYISCIVINPNYTQISQGNTLIVTSTSSNNQQSSSSSSSPSTGNFTIPNLQLTLSINAGEEKSIVFNLSNTLGVGSLTNVTISVTGISLDWYKLSSSKISYLFNGINKQQNITLTFKIPADAEAKDYDVTVEAKGTIYGSSSTRTATKTMKLTVVSTQPQAVPPIATTIAEPTENTTQNITSNTTAFGPTGLAATFEYLKNNMVIIIAIAACLLVFMFRENITTTLMKTAGKPKDTGVKQKTKGIKLNLAPLKDKLNYKIAINLKKDKSKAKNLETAAEDVAGVRRPEMLEKEIKRDIKELQNVLETEKKIEKKNKKIDLGNN